MYIEQQPYMQQPVKPKISLEIAVDGLILSFIGAASSGIFICLYLLNEKKDSELLKEYSNEKIG